MVSRREIEELTIRAGYMRRREDIEEETRRRQGEWNRAPSANVDGSQRRRPPPSSVPMTSSTEPRGAGGLPPISSYSIAAKEPENSLPSEVSWVGRVGKEPQKYEAEKGVYRTRRLVYQSDFTVPTGWDEDHSDKVGVFRDNGFYHIAVYTSLYWAYYYPPNIVSDFRAQVDWILESRSGGRANSGMVFCSTKENGKHEFTLYVRVDRGGFYRLDLDKADNDDIIIDWRTSEYIKKGPELNTLQFEKVGHVVTLWINGLYLAKAAVDCNKPGHVGMFVRSNKGDSYAEAMFRNLLLYAIE